MSDIRSIVRVQKNKKVPSIVFEGKEKGIRRTDGVVGVLSDRNIEGILRLDGTEEDREKTDADVQA